MRSQTESRNMIYFKAFLPTHTSLRIATPGTRYPQTGTLHYQGLPSHLATHACTASRKTSLIHWNSLQTRPYRFLWTCRKVAVVWRNSTDYSRCARKIRHAIRFVAPKKIIGTRNLLSISASITVLSGAAAAATGGVPDHDGSDVSLRLVCSVTGTDDDHETFITVSNMYWKTLLPLPFTEQRLDSLAHFWPSPSHISLFFFFAK